MSTYFNLVGDRTKSFTYYGSGGRALNTAFTISTTRDSFVSYSLTATGTITLTGNTTSTAILQVSPDGTTWTSVSETSSGLSGGVIVGITLSSTQTGAITAIVPANYQVKILTSGTTPTFIMGEEVLL